MDNIDWEALKRIIAENEKQKEIENDNKTCYPDLLGIINGEPVIFEPSPRNNPNNTYATRKRLLSYYKFFRSMSLHTEEAKALYQTVISYLISDYRHLCSSLEEDILELDVCFSVKAYKATLILAGSILEAFLLDWLSEIDGVNYFEEPFKVKVLKKDGSYKMVKKEQLNEYIEQIKELEKPDWMEPSEKAHYIQKRRNSVHAKVCLKEEIDINEETCKNVIKYLKDIVDTRLQKRKKELNCDLSE